MEKESGHQYFGFYRFLLSLMVLWSHSLSLFIPELKIGSFQIGNVAVASFFLLSGYLMNFSIQSWYSNKPNNFIFNRYLRISPPLFVAAILSIIIHSFLLTNSIPLIDGSKVIANELISNSNIIYTILTPFYPFNYIVYKTLFQSTFMTYTFVAYSWAIFIELIFYWLIFLAYKFKIKEIILLISTFLFFIAIDKLYLNCFNFFSSSTFINSFQWAPYFILGTLLTSSFEKNKILILFFGVLSFLHLKFYAVEDYVHVLMLFFFVNMGVFSLVLKSSKKNEFKKIWDKKLGSLSYPIYINQYSISILLFSFLDFYNVNLLEHSLLERIIYYIFYNLIIIFLSKLLISLTDYFTDNFRDKLRGKVL